MKILAMALCFGICSAQDIKGGRYHKPADASETYSMLDAQGKVIGSCVKDSNGTKCTPAAGHSLTEAKTILTTKGK